MNLFNLIKEKVIGKELVVYTNSTEIPWYIKNPKRYKNVNTEYCKDIPDSEQYEVICKRDSETVFHLEETHNCCKQINVTILDVSTDSWGDYDEHDIYLVFHFKYKNVMWKVSSRLENIDETNFNIK